jgi:hypothetical protein
MDSCRRLLSHYPSSPAYSIATTIIDAGRKCIGATYPKGQASIDSCALEPSQTFDHPSGTITGASKLSFQAHFVAHIAGCALMHGLW